jgi:hypothetical protein
MFGLAHGSTAFSGSIRTQMTTIVFNIGPFPAILFLAKENKPQQPIGTNQNGGNVDPILLNNSSKVCWNL